MVKHFYTNIAIRIVIVVLLGVALGLIINSEQPLYNAIALMFLIAILTADVIAYTNRINKKLTYFFDSIQHEDFSQQFSAITGSKTLNRLCQNLKKISDQIENIHIENQRQEKYFEAMIEHISVGILSVNPDGFVVNCNSTAKRVVGLAQLTHIRQIEKVNNKLARLLNGIKLNEEKTITINIGLEQTTLLVKASEFKTNREQLKLISMHDIKKELDEKASTSRHPFCERSTMRTRASRSRYGLNTRNAPYSGWINPLFMLSKWRMYPVLHRGLSARYMEALMTAAPPRVPAHSGMVRGSPLCSRAVPSTRGACPGSMRSTDSVLSLMPICSFSSLANAALKD